MPIFALVDCNNFYASCEKLFQPKLKDRPVVVLSNNDGCIIARSAEAKAMGIPMGTPWHKIRKDAEQQGVIAFSSNYALYADMSNRVVDVLSQFTPNLEVYSIDESFLSLDGVANRNLIAYGQEIRGRILNDLGLPVCVGIGPTKTLAKLANHCAKKSLFGGNGVCDLRHLSADESRSLFSRIDIEEVWGIGRRISTRLRQMGIESVQHLKNADPEWIRSIFSVVMERTVRELNGTSCLELEEVVPDKQQIMCSRSFGRYIYDLPEMEEAVASYISRAAEKLRGQHAVAGALMVYVRTNPFTPNSPQYQKAMTIPLVEATNDTRVLVNWGLRMLKAIFRPGYAYQKAGCMLSEIQPIDTIQASLFSGYEDTARAKALMTTLDKINQRWGRRTLHIAAEGVQKAWQMKRSKLSPRYTTAWSELPKVWAK